MSSRTLGSQVMAPRALVVAAALGLWATAVRSLEVVDLPLQFGPDSDAQGLVATIAGLDSIASSEQLVLELSVEALNLAAEEDLLLALRITCPGGGEDVELLSSLELFPTEPDGIHRRVLFDLSALAVLDSLPCSPRTALIWLSPMDEGVRIPAEEASDAKLQLVWF